jgi:predicted HD phosphohydrolase
MDLLEPRTAFASIAESTAQDWGLLATSLRKFAMRLPDRVMAHLQLLDGDFGGFPIDRMQHSLQCATRAHRDGRDERYVVMALLHDIGDSLGTFNHPDVAAAIISPFVSPDVHWICQQHGIFQGYYFFHHLGMDRDAREAFRGHANFPDCAEFCAKYDGPAFDSAYDSAPLSFFEPMLRRVMAQPLGGMPAGVC